MAAVVALSTILSSGPALAAVGVATSLTVPTSMAVGQDINGSFTVINTNTVPNHSESNTLTQVRLTPSCGNLGSAANPCPTPDPEVFSVVSATGAAGTACAGIVFTPSAPDASGSVVLTPTVPVSLAPPGGAAGTDRCTINFTLRTLRVPSIDTNPAAAGVQTRLSGRGQLTSQSGLTVASLSSVEVTVVKGTPTLTTQVANPTVQVGGAISDTATVTFPAGAAPPTGTIAFTVFGPNNATCAGAPIAQSTNALGGGTATTRTATSGSFPVNQPGTYRFVAVYSGDANYNSATSPCNAPNETVNVTAAPVEAPPADFDGNGTTDVSVFRPTNGAWYLRTTSPIAVLWGQNGDVPVPGDYDGNGTTDIAVFRPGDNVWYVRTASPFAVVWGAAGDIPVPGDYDGNGTTDIAVFRPANGAWYLRTASPTAVVWGVAGDIPVPGDYDGDGTTDIAVFRPASGTWYLRTTSPTAIIWGQNGDVPEPGDYDGNGTTDLAVFRPGNNTWYVRTTSPFAVVWGTAGDRPLPLPDAIRRFFFSP